MIPLALSWLASALPGLWALPALGAAGLWLYGWLAPSRIAAEAVRLGSLGLVGVAVYLWVWSEATAACTARVAAATAEETARQQVIVGGALTRSREEGAAAMAAEAEARRSLEAALAALDILSDAPAAVAPGSPVPPPTAAPAPRATCGLSLRAVEALPR